MNAIFDSLCRRNNPPPDVLLNLLQRFNKAKKINHNTREKTVKAFKVHFTHPFQLGLSDPASVLTRSEWVANTPLVFNFALSQDTGQGGPPRGRVGGGGGREEVRFSQYSEWRSQHRYTNLILFLFPLLVLD